MNEIELNKIHNIDCLEFMKTLPDKCIDMTLTSPPYDNLRDYNGYSFDFEGIAKELYRVTKDGGVVVWVVGDATVNGSETGTSFKQALYFKEIGFNLHDTMIYQKSNFSFPCSNRYHQIFEYMFVFSKGTPRTFNGLIDRKNIYVGQKPHSKIRDKNNNFVAVKSSKRCKENGVREYGLRYNIWRFVTGGGHSSKDKVAYQHPAIFPEKLAEDHILSWSNEADIIYDPFMGSGTTGKMAQILKRKWIGSEISKEYCDIAEQRIKSISNTLF